MKWAVETLNEIVDAELEQLPVDMRARFIRVVGLIEEFGAGPSRATPCETFGRPTMGDETIREIGYFKSPLCHGPKKTSGGGQGFYQEDTKNTAS